MAPSNELLAQTIPSQYPQPACDQHPGRHPWHCIGNLVASAPKSVECIPRGRKKAGIGDKSLKHLQKTQETLGILGLRAKLDSWHKTWRKLQARDSGVSVQPRVSGMMGLPFCALSGDAQVPWLHLTCGAEKPPGQPETSRLICPHFLLSFA